MRRVKPPNDIGEPRLELYVPADAGPEPAVLPRLVKAVVVGTIFSLFPVILTNLILTRAEPGFDPVSLAAAIPVIAVAFWLFRPRERWYAVGDRGFALGEKFFGEIRWENVPFADIDAVEIELRRLSSAAGTYRFTGYRIIWDGGRKKRVVLEGQVDEPEPHGAEVRLPSERELPAQHELRAILPAIEAWERATGRRAGVSGGARR